MTARRSRNRDNSDNFPEPEAIGVLLDLVPPFEYLSSDDHAIFSRLVKRFGVQKVFLNKYSRPSFFLDLKLKVPYCYVAPRAALDAADGALDPYFSSGFLEEIIPPHLDHPEMHRVVGEACGLLQTKINGKTVRVIPAAAPVRRHLSNILSTQRGTFLESGDDLHRLLKGIALAARLFVPAGDKSKARLSDPISPLQRPRALRGPEIKALQLNGEKTAPPMALVFGLERRGRNEPMAFLPMECVKDDGKVLLKLPDRPFACLLAGRRLDENSERNDVETHVIDLDLPAITPWEVAWPLILDRVAAAFCSTLGRAETGIDDIVFRDEGREKSLLSWIEVMKSTPIPSPSLDRLDRLALLPDPVQSAPGLARLASHAACRTPDDTPLLERASRLAHADPKFPLDPYQSRAAAGVASLAGNWIQTVTGPPGTGKTSMMRDVISDRITQGVIEASAPSLLLAGPTTQAYENLLDAVRFTWSGSPDAKCRPFPDYPHIGAIVPTSTALSEPLAPNGAPHLKFTKSRKANLHEDFETLVLPADCGFITGDPATIDKLRLLLLGGPDLPLSEDACHAEIAETVSAIESARDTIAALHILIEDAGFDGTRKIQWPAEHEPVQAAFEARFWSSAEPNPLIRLNAALDVTLRHSIFHLAFQAMQLRFIDAAYSLRQMQEDLKRRKSLRKTDREILLQSFKDAICWLLPIRTATVTSFGGKAIEQFGHPASMVVIDEAGMMEPQFVPTVLAEGKSTLAVGDPYQIAPVGSDTLPIHAAILTRAGVSEEIVSLWAKPEFPPHGLEPAQKAGNGISVLESMSDFRGRDALVLQRHYRCPPSIMEIANDLVYRPRGIPLEAVKSDPVPMPGHLPVLATVLHEGAPDPTANVNFEEASAICTAFLRQHRAILSMGKGAPPLDEITLDAHLEFMASSVAFISPYRGQAKLEILSKLPKYRQKQLTELYRKHLPEGADIAYEGFLPNLMLARLREALPGQDGRVRQAVESTVFGTIHALQGAERPVVFLSCVADENTQFFNSDPSLINVAVTRAQSKLVIARSTQFAQKDMPGTPAREIAETLRKSEVILPDRLLVVESRDKARAIEKAMPHLLKVVTTRGNIGTVSGLKDDGKPEIEITPSAPHVATGLAEAREWITPRDQGGLGIKKVILALDNDDAGDVIAHDMMQVLGLDRPTIQRRGLTLTRYRLEDPALLGSHLPDEIAQSPTFNPEVTGRWRAERQRARSELRTALSRGVAARLRQDHPGTKMPSLPVLRTMRWLEEREATGWEIETKLVDASGREFIAPLSLRSGRLATFKTEAAAQSRADELRSAPTKEPRSLVVPSPIHTRRSLYDVLAVLGWADIAPLRAMKVIQRLFEKSLSS